LTDPESGPVFLPNSGEPGWSQREASALLKYQGWDGWGPQAPKRGPGDKYTIIGTTIGMVVAAAAGFLINLFLGFLGIVVGGVAGALIGFQIGKWINRGRTAGSPDVPRDTLQGPQ
jgi:hypothetical protein